ncbi:ABC transporter ATP-binding protein [Reinekea marina]|uniref:ABC transporter ATP-binding protein n=1 Tax=Reinekea marina TaxID=1310421 RepID=A0ABV7WXT3_9GAMM|nr:ABC transporter ATP-binding protein [Reinekea marina]MDN3650142.1 ABC transporter ATP-binding protein [Reinekea marina]
MLSFFERILNPFPSQQPEQPPSTLIQFCLHYTRGMWWPILFVSLLTSLVAIAEASMFGMIGVVIDWLSTSNPETFLIDYQFELVAISILLLVVIPGVVLLHSMLVHQTLLGNYPMAIRWQAHRYLIKQSLSFYQNDFAGRVATKLMQTSLSVRESVMKLLDVLVYVVIYFITMVFLVGNAEKILVIPMLVWLVGYITIQRYYVPKLRNVAAEQADARSLMTGRIVDSYTNIQTVKLFAHTEREADYSKEGMDGFLKTVHKQMRLVTGLNLCIEWLNYTLVFSIGALSVYLWLQGSITVGAIAVALALALRLNGMSHWIMWEVTALFENIGTVIDGISTLSKPIAIEDKPNAPALNVHQGAIEFDQVGFHYGKGAGVIDSFNLQIKPGEKVGLVGRSGAGKSTLVNLLLRFYDVETGAIRIDGQEISSVQQESLRAQIGMVTQDTMLLHRSVRENILYGKPDATEDELLAACKKAEALDFIADLTDPNGLKGFDAQVGERGIKLSGGQRQRIAIARALLKDAPILVLDEATSALDSEVEAAIQENLYKLMEGKSVIAIAHRLSTIAAMDRLVVMDQGRIVEQGTHQELIAQGGIYNALWQHQTGGFLGEE